MNTVHCDLTGKDCYFKEKMYDLEEEKQKRAEFINEAHIKTLKKNKDLEEFLNRITVKINKVTASYRHTNEVPNRYMIDLCNFQIDLERFLKDGGYLDSSFIELEEYRGTLINIHDKTIGTDCEDCHKINSIAFKTLNSFKPKMTEEEANKFIKEMKEDLE